MDINISTKMIMYNRQSGFDVFCLFVLNGNGE